MRMTVHPSDDSPLGRARLSLEGLSLGDAFGQRFFVSPAVVASFLASRTLPAGPWYWTDDTAMALSVYEALATEGAIHSDSIARRFATRYRSDPARGYGEAAHTLLMAISLGVPWQEAAAEAFDGQGSMGNGAAMRSAPIGAYFSDELDAVVAAADASAAPTHAHPDGKAGAVAVAVAAALAVQMRRGERAWSGADLLAETFVRTPAGPTREGLAKALELPFEGEVARAAMLLGNGGQVISSDTVPFSLWCAARHLSDFETALWATVSGLGDRDTTCAIVGGIVALAVGHAGLPKEMLSARESLDSRLTAADRHSFLR